MKPPWLPLSVFPRRRPKGDHLYPAQLLGVGDRLGSLEAGKAATLLVTNGDPLDFPTQIEAAYIDGRKIDLTNRQTRLRDKYREKYRRK